MKKQIITFGLIAGFISSIWFIIMMIMGVDSNLNMEMGMLIGYATMFIAFILIFVAVKNYRDKMNHGAVSFGKAFKIGLYISLIASTVYVLIWQIEYFYFIPDFLEKYTSAVLDKMKAKGSSMADIEAKRKEMADMAVLYKNPLFNALFTYMEILPPGLVVSLISAAILKRKKGNEEAIG